MSSSSPSDPNPIEEASNLDPGYIEITPGNGAPYQIQKVGRWDELPPEDAKELLRIFETAIEQMPD